MEKLRNVTVSEDVWAELKQRALDERVTLREVVERAAHQYLGGAVLPVMPEARKSILYESDGMRPVLLKDEKHWTKDDDPA